MAGDLVHEGGAVSAARRLADLPHADFVRIMQHVVEYLDRANDAGLSLCARDLRDVIAQGATRAAFGKLPPKAPRGGSHGRGPAVEQAPELLTAMRRQLELDGHSNAEAARLLREFLSDLCKGEDVLADRGHSIVVRCVLVHERRGPLHEQLLYQRRSRGTFLLLPVSYDIDSQLSFCIARSTSSSQSRVTALLPGSTLSSMVPPTSLKCTTRR